MGARTFKKEYMPRDVQEKMSPEELLAYMRLKDLNQMLEKRAKEKAGKK